MRFRRTVSLQPPWRPLALVTLAAAYLWIPVIIGHWRLEAYYPGQPISNVVVAWVLAAGVFLLTRGLKVLGPRLAGLIGLMGVHAAFLARVADLGLRDFHGQGFSREFFYHFEWRALGIAFQEYPWTAGSVLLLMALFSWGWLRIFPKRAAPPPPRILAVSALGAGGALLGLLFTFPVGHLPLQHFARQLAAYYRTPAIHAHLSADHDLLARYGIQPIPHRSNRIEATAAPDPANLITIYLESLNLALTGPGGSPYTGITPNLDRLMARHTFLENFLGTEGFTMAGLMSSLCGVSPLLKMGNDSLIAENGRYAELPCMTDILRHAGYYQVYLGGADKAFAGKAGFLQFHGYDEIYGWEDWIHHPDYRYTHNPWGIHDHDLFEEAYRAVLRLEDQAPYHLTLLTLNTHLPGYHSDQCAPPGNDPFLDGLYCTDRALGRFLNRLDQGGHLARTVVAILADHPLFNNPQTRELLASRISDPRVAGLIIDPAKRLPRRIPFAAATFDLAPTLLDLLEIRHNGEFIQGRSLLGPRAREQNFIARDFFVHQGRVGRAATRQACDRQEPELTGTFPPSACEQKQALAVMDGHAAQFHRCKATTACAMLAGGEIRAAGSAPNAEIRLPGGNGLPQLVHEKGRLDSEARQGMLVLVGGAEGEVQERRFFQLCAEKRDVAEFSCLLEDLTPQQALLLATRGRTLGCLDSGLRQLLAQFGLIFPDQALDSASLAFVGRHGAAPGRALQAFDLQGRPVSLTITAQACQRLFAPSS